MYKHNYTIVLASTFICIRFCANLSSRVKDDHGYPCPHLSRVFFSRKSWVYQEGAGLSSYTRFPALPWIDFPISRFPLRFPLGSFFTRFPDFPISLTLRLGRNARFPSISRFPYPCGWVQKCNLTTPQYPTSGR